MLNSEVLKTQELQSVESTTVIGGILYDNISTLFLIAVAVLTTAFCLQSMQIIQSTIPLLMLPLAVLLAVCWFVGLWQSLALLALISFSALMSSSTNPHELNQSLVINQTLFCALNIMFLSIVKRFKSSLTFKERLERYQKNHDELTNLLTREAFVKKLDALLADGSDAKRFGMLLFTINDLEGINQRHGYQTGNRALSSIAKRLHQATQEGDLLSRIDGNCFALTVHGVSHNAQLAGYLKRVNAMVNMPFHKGWSPILLETKAVSSFYPIDGKTAEELLTVAQERLLEVTLNPQQKTEFEVELTDESTDEFDKEFDREFNSKLDSMFENTYQSRPSVTHQKL